MLPDNVLMSLQMLLQSTTSVACNIFALYSNAALMAVSLTIWQVWNEDQPDEEVLAMVVRTGLCTAMGDMLRQVVAPVNETSPFKDPFVMVRLFGMRWQMMLLVAQDHEMHSTAFVSCRTQQVCNVRQLLHRSRVP